MLLVGGMTRMPAVRSELARVTGREPSAIANPEEVVAVGAALEVARLDGTIEGVLLDRRRGARARRCRRTQRRVRDW